MIIQALNEYYGRLVEDSDSKISLPGFGNQSIHFALVLNKNGDLVQVKDLRDSTGKKNIPAKLNVPEAVKRSSGISPNFMWDNTRYVLGADNKENPERAMETFQSFKQLHHRLGDEVNDEGMKALLCFVDTWNPEKATELDHWDEMAGMNIVFQIDGELRYLHQSPDIKEAWLNHYRSKSSEKEGLCLITGERLPIARLHANIKGVRDRRAQPGGASLISFNKPSFLSYGKEQNYNAPVNEHAAFAYTTALNYLLNSDSRQKVQIGDATTVFWTEHKSRIIEIMGTILESKNDSDVKDIRDFLNAVRSGKKPDDIDFDDKFYILGLSPNAARLSVRFWHVSTVGEMSARVVQHFDDLAICKSYDNDPEFPGVWQLLIATVPHRKSEKPKSDSISPVLAGSLIRSILTGSVYPRNLLTTMIGRIRADQNINYIRASLIKAYLNRNWRINKKSMEVTMALNKEETNTAYRLGRLFSILEAAQKDAIGKDIGASIKDRYFGSATATPNVVFPRLIVLAQKHIEKGKYGRYFNNCIGEIMQGIQGFPSTLSLEDQGMFVIGYYHQKNYKENNNTLDELKGDE